MSPLSVPLRWFLYDWLCAVWFVDFAMVLRLKERDFASSGFSFFLFFSSKKPGGDAQIGEELTF